MDYYLIFTNSAINLLSLSLTYNIKSNIVLRSKYIWEQFVRCCHQLNKAAGASIYSLFREFLYVFSLKEKTPF